jgi:hypothetical protein
MVGFPKVPVGQYQGQFAVGRCCSDHPKIQEIVDFPKKTLSVIYQ